MTPDEKARDFRAFKRAWLSVPSQDNEGYVPDRGAFKCGWFAALRYVRTSAEWKALEEIAETARHFSAQFKTIDYRPKSLSEVDQMYVAISCSDVDIALNILDRIRKEGESG